MRRNQTLLLFGFFPEAAASAPEVFEFFKRKQLNKFVNRAPLIIMANRGS